MRRISKKLKWMALIAMGLCMALVVCTGLRSMQENIEAAAVRLNEGEQIDQATAFKTLRQQLRAMQKAQLNEIAHGADTDEALSGMAQRELIELCQREEMELTIEGVLSMRGFEEPVVTVHGDSVNVLLRGETITQQQSAVILELVCRETGVQSGNIKIIPIN